VYEGTVKTTVVGACHWSAAMAYTRGVVWEAVFMLVVLKIPIVYLCVVVWWAIRAEPRPEEPAALVPAVPDTPAGWSPRERLGRRPPRPGPGRRPSPRRAGVGRARASR
jgi:hypothetical protein